MARDQRPGRVRRRLDRRGRDAAPPRAARRRAAGALRPHGDAESPCRGGGDPRWAPPEPHRDRAVGGAQSARRGSLARGVRDGGRPAGLAIRIRRPDARAARPDASLAEHHACHLPPDGRCADPADAAARRALPPARCRGRRADRRAVRLQRGRESLRAGDGGGAGTAVCRSRRRRPVHGRRAVAGARVLPDRAGEGICRRGAALEPRVLRGRSHSRPTVHARLVHRVMGNGRGPVAGGGGRGRRPAPRSAGGAG